jgi:hypothetical protein
MAPFSRALHVDRVSSTENDSAVYRGVVDSEWLVVTCVFQNICPPAFILNWNIVYPMAVIHPTITAALYPTLTLIALGYILGLMVDAVMNFQSTTPHKDPIHVTAHFLRQSAVEPFEIHLRVLRSGKIFTNIIAEFIQKVHLIWTCLHKKVLTNTGQNTLKVTTHMIFSHNAPAPGNNTNLTLQPPSPYARRIPFHVHPSEVPTQVKSGHPRHQFTSHIESAGDKEIVARNAPDHPNRTNSSTIGGQGLEWGSWFGFSGKEERITCASIPFWVDMFSNLPSMLPPSERKGMISRSVYNPDHATYKRMLTYLQLVSNRDSVD